MPSYSGIYFSSAKLYPGDCIRSQLPHLILLESIFIGFFSKDIDRCQAKKAEEAKKQIYNYYVKIKDNESKECKESKYMNIIRK